MASCPAASTYHSPLQFLSFPWEIPILSIFTIVIFLFLSTIFPGLSRWLSGKEFICQCRRCGFDSSLDQEDPLEMRKEIHSSILAWETPWTEEPGGLRSIESQRVRHTWSKLACMHKYCKNTWIGNPVNCNVLVFGWDIIILLNLFQDPVYFILYSENSGPFEGYGCWLCWRLL